MDVILIALALTVFLLGLALFTNRARRLTNIDFELQPNCLLTRWPLLLITGPRSVFYFSAYWNLYSPYLAEHGYEVFTLHLPWNDPRLRRERFEYFLRQQEELGRHFHLIMDASTLSEFAGFLREHKSTAILSLTEIKDQDTKSPATLSAFPIPMAEIEMQASRKSSLFLRLSYGLHKLMIRHKNISSLSCLGACPDTALSNASLLLDRARTLAEMDLREA